MLIMLEVQLKETHWCMASTPTRGADCAEQLRGEGHSQLSEHETTRCPRHCTRASSVEGDEQRRHAESQEELLGATPSDGPPEEGEDEKSKSLFNYAKPQAGQKLLLRRRAGNKKSSAIGRSTGMPHASTAPRESTL